MTSPILDYQARIDEICGTVVRLVFSLPGQRNRLSKELAEAGWPASATITACTFGDTPAPPIHSSTFQDQIDALANGGHDETLVGNICTAYIYSLWEDKYREDIAHSRNKKKTEMKSELFRELGTYRHAIIHNQSQGTSRTAALKILPAVPSGSKLRIDRNVFELIITKIKAELGAILTGKNAA